MKKPTSSCKRKRLDKLLPKGKAASDERTKSRETVFPLVSSTNDPVSLITFVCLYLSVDGHYPLQSLSLG